MDNSKLDRLVGTLVGLAVCDALGMVLEFKDRGTFQEITDMEAGGPFDLPLGYWTDDTSMALCLADSLLAMRGYDSFDVMNRYTKWHDKGYRSSTGVCFDIGNQVSLALSSYKQTPIIPASAARTTSAGNGCIMRLAPVVIASTAAGSSINDTMKLAAVSARETHFSTLAETCTKLFANMLVKAVSSNDKNDILAFADADTTEDTQVTSLLQNAAAKQPEELRPTGYIVDTLEVATWAFMTTDNFKDGALKAVNMGGDSDTIGAVYGQLAGAYYGLSNIPTSWTDRLYMFGEIKALASQLAQMNQFRFLKSRFEEDGLAYSQQST